MLTIPAGLAHTETFPFQDALGAEVEPTGLSWRLLDEEDGVVQDATAIPSFSGSSIDIVVPMAKNTLAPGVSVAMRVIELTLQTADQPIFVTKSYLIRAAAPLTIFVNSFQTLRKAVVIAADMPNLFGWDAGDDNARTPALILAFQRLTKLGYLIDWPLDIDAQNVLDSDETDFEFAHWRRVTPRMWPFMTAERWETWYPEEFRQAMYRAQVAEADQILLTDPTSSKRRLGVLSETIGESSMMFRSSKPLDLGISREALDHLKGYVRLRTTISRA